MPDVPSKEVNLHANHRQRVRAHFEKDGLDTFADHNVLEMMLFYCIPRLDTNEIAHELLNQFGSLSGVLEADINALLDVPGIGHESAVYIKFLNSLFRRYYIDRGREQTMIMNDEDAKNFMEPYFLGENEEIFMAVLLDGCQNVRKIAVVDRGNEESVSVNVNRVFREVVNNHASAVVLAHSHPNGFARPSRDDINITLELAKKLAAINVKLCDHLIFSKNDVCFLSRDKAVPDARFFTFRE